MQRVVSDKLGVLTDLCRKHGVRRLELFGSATTHSFDAARSDLDLWSSSRSRGEGSMTSTSG
jgi:predicted nucleotidyltransferase